MIKLEVNHGKHKKQGNGKKLTVPDPSQKPKQEKIVEQKSPKDDKKKNKNKKQDKKQGKEKKKEQKQSSKKPQQKKENKKQATKGKQGDKQLQTIERIKKQGEKTKVTIDQLINQYKNVADDIFVNHGHNPQKQMIIGKKLQELKKQKQERHAKISKIDEKIAARQERMIERVNGKIDKKEERKKQRHKKKAQNKIQMLKVLSQERLQKQAKFQQWLHNEYKKRVPRHQQIKKEYQQKELEYQQKVKQILQKNKRKFAPMNIEEIQDFEDDYETHKYEILEQNDRKRDEIREIIDQENRQFYGKIWKGKCHKNVKNQLKQFLQKKNQAKTKLQKTKEYGTLVKSSFKPKIDDKKRNHSLAIERTVNSYMLQNEEGEQDFKYKRVAREKYVQGVNKGLVLQKMRKSLDHDEKVKKGNEYLEHIRALPKVRKDGAQSAGLQQVPVGDQSTNTLVIERKKSPSTTFKQKRLKNPYYRSSLSDRIPSKGDDKRIKEPEVVNYLLADIKARHNEMELEQKVIKHGRYNGILDLQNHHNSLNKKIVQSINDKLQILSRI